MLIVLKNTWPLMLGMLLLTLGNGLQGTLLGVRGSIEQMETQMMGFVMSAYFVGFLGGSRLAPILVQRVGHVRVFAALGSLVSAAFILFPIWVSPWFWIVLRLVIGFCFSGIYVVAESWLNDRSSNDTRGQALSMYLMVQMSGIVVGQLLLNIADPAGFELFVLITVLVSISFAPILLSSSPAPIYATAKPMSLRELITASPLGCVGMFLLGGVFASLFGMASVFATQRGLSFAEISYFVTSIYVGGLLVQYPIGWLSDRIDRRLLIVATAAMCAVVSVGSLSIGDSLVWLTLAGFFIGGTTNPMYSLLIAYTNDFLDTDQMASASGGMLFINGVGAMGGPIVVGYLMTIYGPSAFFGYIGLLMALIGGYGIYRMTQRASTTVDEMAPYLPISNRTTQVAVEIAIEAVEDEQADQAENP
jgi:MFS family permease